MDAHSKKGIVILTSGLFEFQMSEHSPEPLAIWSNCYLHSSWTIMLTKNFNFSDVLYVSTFLMNFLHTHIPIWVLVHVVHVHYYDLKLFDKSTTHCMLVKKVLHFCAIHTIYSWPTMHASELSVIFLSHAWQ